MAHRASDRGVAGVCALGAPRRAVVGATLLDGTGRAPLADAVVVVEGARIVTVQAGGASPLPDSVETIDARGGWLVPGLIDVHVHAEGVTDFDRLRRWGVSTICNPAATGPLGGDSRPAASEPRPLRVLRAGVPIDGVPSPFPYADEVHDEAEIRRAVRRQVADGADFVKLYTGLAPPLVQAGIDEAHACGVAAIGDLMATSWTEAARFGIDLLCHALPQHESLLPPAARGVYTRQVESRRPGAGRWWLEQVDLAGPEISMMISALVSHKVQVQPTLVSLRRLAAEDETGAAWNKILAFTSLLARAEVELLAGTDAPRTGVPAGESLHDEMELLVRVGLSPRRALAAATGRAARALGLAGETGLITAGRRADMVLLQGNPEESIRHTRDIVWAMAGGIIERPWPHDRDRMSEL